MPSPETSRTARIPALDGIRAVACLAVVAGHAGLPLRGYTYGVDVFFVLSGFLITGILADEIADRGRIDLAAFYARRAIRLFPALALMTVIAATLALTIPRGGGHLQTALPATLFYVANWAAAWDTQSLGLFGHAWSLSIEEQFYLAWPLALPLVLARRRRVAVLLSAALLVCLARAAGRTAIGSSVMLWTPLRVDGLLVGAALALALRQRPETVARLCSRRRALIAGVVACLLIAAPKLPPEAQLLGIPLVGVSTAIVIGHVAITHGSVLERLLSVAPARAVGVRSYGLYLYHAPILSAVDANLGHRAVLLLGLPASAAITAASYRWLEVPCMGWGHRRLRRSNTVSSRPAVQIEPAPR